MNLGILEEVKDLRTVWPHEASDFTPWLAEEDNIVVLGDAVGLDISIDETESPVGAFSLDISASEIGTERKIIIENQLEDTDHEHLGKLITYASGKEADIIIWVVKHAREEHKAAIEWLNNHTDDKIGFFLCEIKLYKIGNSSPAVKFEVVEKPNDWTKEIKKNALTNPTQQQRFEYWTKFNEYAFENVDFSKQFNQRKASSDHWMDFSLGSSAYHIGMLQLRKRNALSVEFYINEDKELFKKLYQSKEAIEQECGFSLDWKELPDKKASRILVEKKFNLENKDKWPEQFEWLMDTASAMKRGFKKYL